MATDSNEFNDILKRLDKLNSEERQEPMDRLQQSQTTATGVSESGRSSLDGFKERGLLGSIKDAHPAEVKSTSARMRIYKLAEGCPTSAS